MEAGVIGNFKLTELEIKSEDLDSQDIEIKIKEQEMDTEEEVRCDGSCAYVTMGQEVNKDMGLAIFKKLGEISRRLENVEKSQKMIVDHLKICSQEVYIEDIPSNNETNIKINVPLKLDTSTSELPFDNNSKIIYETHIHEVSEEMEEPSTSTIPKKKKLNPKVRTSPLKNPMRTYEYHATSYVLPEISKNSKLGVALQKKKPLTKGLKSLFLTKIFDSFASKKKFYVEQGYEEIVHAILNAYPYLGGILPYESAKHLWLRSLNAKFCNERKRADYKEEISRCKNKRMEQKSLNVVAGEGSSMFGIPYYHPKVTIDGEEDQISVDSHKKWMSLEINLADRNMSGITSRMKITFIDRRNILFTDDHGAPTNILAGDILKEYPCLGIEDQAIGEIRRLFGESYKQFEKYESRFVSFSQKLHEAVCNSKSKYKSYMNELFCSGNSCKYENFIMYKCLGNISVLLLENPEKVISKSLNETRAPMLNVTMEEEVNVTVDGTLFIHRVSPRNSVFLWLAAFFIFNVRPANNRRTFDVLQHLLFNIPEKPKFNQAAMKIVDFWSGSH